MLPLIVIGATPPMRHALEPYAQAGHIEYHPTAEVAHYALADAATHPEADGRWPVHVAYGPDAYGGVIVERAARLPHTGHTLVLGWNIDHEPNKPRRVTDGRITGTDPNTLVWQAGTVVSADKVIDLATDAGLPFLVRYLEWKDGS